jgi:hypothetical protein
MIASMLLLAMQMVQTLPPPTAEVTSATQWNCGFDQADGEEFWLKGTFPEVPAGWDVNAALPTAIEGSGPEVFTGDFEVKPFSATASYRRYYVAAPAPEGGHYNMMFLLLADDTGMATIEHWNRDPATGRGTFRAVANGSCEATFAPATPDETGQP